METTKLKLFCDEGPMKGESLECVPGSITRIGRSERMNNYSISDPGISKTHLEIGWDGENWMIVDSYSSNGTQVNGERIPRYQKFSINDGDAIKVGMETILVAKIERKIANSQSVAYKQQYSDLCSGKILAENMALDTSKIYSGDNNPVIHEIKVGENLDALLVNLEINDGPESLIDQAVETNDARNLKDSDLSGCQVKTNLPSIPAVNNQQAGDICTGKILAENMAPDASKISIGENNPVVHEIKVGENLDTSLVNPEINDGSESLIDQAVETNDARKLKDSDLSRCHVTTDFPSIPAVNNQQFSDIYTRKFIADNMAPVPGASKISIEENNPVVHDPSPVNPEINDAPESLIDQVVETNDARNPKDSDLSRSQVSDVCTGKNFVENMALIPEASKISIEGNNSVVHKVEEDLDASIVNSDINDAPKSLIDQAVETNDARKFKDSNLSGCHVKTDLLSSFEAIIPNRKRKSEVFSVNQTVRQMPRRAATKKYVIEKKPDVILGVPDDAKMLADRESNDWKAYFLRSSVLPHGVGKRPFVKNQLVKVSEKIGQQVIEDKDKLKGKTAMKRKCQVFSVNQPIRHMIRRVATKKYAPEKKTGVILGVTTDGAKILADKSLKRDRESNNCEAYFLRSSVLPHGAGKKLSVKKQLLKASEKIDQLAIEDKHKLEKKTVTKRGSGTNTYAHLQPSKAKKRIKGCTMQSVGVIASNDRGRACKLQHEKISGNSHAKMKRHLPKEVKELKDLVKITLDEWFDRMEKHISNKIETIADEIIAKLKQERCVLARKK